MGGGAWPFLVGGAIRLVDSDNERDSGLLTSAPMCVRFLLRRARAVRVRRRCFGRAFAFVFLLFARRAVLPLCGGGEDGSGFCSFSLLFRCISVPFGVGQGGAGAASSTACGRACGFRRVRVGFLTHFLEGRVAESHTRRSDNRSVMPLDVRGRTRATLEVSAGTSPRPERAGKPLNHLP